MRIRLRSTGAVMFEDELRAYMRANNGPSWDRTTPEVLEALGADVVFPTPQPTFDPVIRVAREIAPQQTANGNWEQRWEVVPRFTQYTDEQGVVHTVAEQEAAAIAADKAQRAEAVKAAIVTATQQRLDNFAQSRNYSGILSACTYATSPTPRFAAEGQYCVAVRDATWAKLYAMLGEVLAGTRPMPTGFADVEPELPALVWPA